MTALAKELDNYLKGIHDLDQETMTAAQSRLDNLCKPPGSLGKLEEIAAQIAGVSGNIYNELTKRCVIIMSSDNGVVEEGVAAAPQSVTYFQTLNFTRGVTGVTVIADVAKSDIMVVDVGINGDISHPQIIDRKIRKGTSNLAKGPAMTREEAEKAILIGIEMVKRASDEGYKIIGAGEMGIGNTTTASSVLCSLADVAVDAAVGKGAGLNETAFNHKKEIITKAVDSISDTDDTIDILSKVGGFDIAAMAGVYIGAAYYRLPVVIDGFISAVAALAAYKLSPLAKEFMIPSHISYEPGYTHVMREMELEPSLLLDMRLGEGSGCPLMFMIADAACAIIKNMATFDEAAIDEDYLNNIQEGDCFTVV